jgi:hypothetical protein
VLWQLLFFQHSYFVPWFVCWTFCWIPFISCFCNLHVWYQNKILLRKETGKYYFCQVNQKYDITSMEFIDTCFRGMGPLPRIQKIVFGWPNKNPRNQNRFPFWKLPKYILQIALNDTKEINERYWPQTKNEVSKDLVIVVMSNFVTKTSQWQSGGNRLHFFWDPLPRTDRDEK